MKFVKAQINSKELALQPTSVKKMAEKHQEVALKAMVSVVPSQSTVVDVNPKIIQCSCPTILSLVNAVQLFVQ